MSSHDKHPMTTEQFLSAIPGSGGIITTIAHRVGCAWMTARRYIDSHPTVLKAYKDECESIVDMAEGTLLKSIKEGNTQDAKWYLARMRRDKYGDNLDITSAGEPVKVVVEYVRKAD